MKYSLPASRFLLALALFAGACGGTRVGNGNLQVELTDAAAAFDSVNVTLGAIEAHYRADEEGQGNARWVTLVAEGGTHDLLTLQNDLTAILGSRTISAGTYDQLRFIVTAANVVTDGTTHHLTIPSGSETGLKLKYSFTIEEERDYQLVLDFDAGNSIKQRGTGEYFLEPVISVKSFQPR